MLDWLGFKPTPRKFAHALMDFARNRGFDEPMRFDPAGFRILTGASEAGVVNLTNLYPDYRDAPRAARTRHLERYFSLFGDTPLPASFEEAKPNLLPAIRARSYFESVRLNAINEGTAWIGTAGTLLGGDAVTMVAYDRDESMTILTAHQLAQWGVSHAVALEAALDNLRDISGDRFILRSDGVTVGNWNDVYDSSRLLLPDLIHRAGVTNPVAMVPTRGVLLLAPANDRAALLAMLDLAHTAYEQEGRSVSASMFQLKHAVPENYIPEDAEIARRANAFRQIYLADDYAAQKQFLDALHEKQGKDIFVASFVRARSDNGDDEFSICTWTESVDSLLPVTQKVALVRMDDNGEPQRAGIVDWEQVGAVAGHLMELQADTFPTRYRVTGFPDLGLLGAR